MIEKTPGEIEVERLLADIRRNNRLEGYRAMWPGSYNKWPLKDVPFAVIWNTFSRSNQKLEVE